MARKKKSAQTDTAANGSSNGNGNGNGNGSPATPNPPPPPTGSASTKKPAGEPSTSALIICRNKYVFYGGTFSRTSHGDHVD
jgi:hypothetical protein